jgi:hypothetical protein
MALNAPHGAATPRADAAIAATLQTLATVQFDQDPLLDAIDSFRFSLIFSAIKREGLILERALEDAIDAAPHLRLLHVPRRRSCRRLDVVFEHIPTTTAVGIELKEDHSTSREINVNSVMIFGQCRLFSKNIWQHGAPCAKSVFI